MTLEFLLHEDESRTWYVQAIFLAPATQIMAAKVTANIMPTHAFHVVIERASTASPIKGWNW